MPIYPYPKPPKKERKPSRLSRRNKSDGREVLITHGADWEAQREIVGERAGYVCENCCEPAPLCDLEIECEEGIMPLLIRAGQAAHIIPRRAGGATRNDNADNLGWLCWVCHRLEHDGKLKLDWERIVAAR